LTWLPTEPTLAPGGKLRSLSLLFLFRRFENVITPPWGWILWNGVWDKYGHLWSSFCYVFVFILFWDNTKVEDQLGDNYIFLDLFNFEGDFRKRTFPLCTENSTINQSQTILKTCRRILDKLNSSYSFGNGQNFSQRYDVAVQTLYHTSKEK
jgi:hypothetical protein